MRTDAILGCVLLGTVARGPPSEEEIKREFEAYVAARNQCSVNDDCVLASADCPLGCYAAVNRVYQAEVEAKARELVSEWGKGGGGAPPIASRRSGLACDYPNQNPAFHMVCACLVNEDAGSGSSWACAQSAACPSTQPAYDLSQNCTGPAVCTYSTPPYHCGCATNGCNGNWVCW
jgi:hypothetical protein